MLFTFTDSYIEYRL